MSNHLENVKTLVMPTCNRVESAGKSLRTFIENSLRFDLECEYVVYDDSLSPQVRENYRSMLRALHRDFGVPILYAGLDEKVSFLKQLLVDKEIPPDVAKFGLFDVYRHGASTLGANRNAVMLDNPGRPYVSVDDDTFCRIIRLSDASDDIEFIQGDVYSASEPCEFVSFRDREHLLASLDYTDTPFLKVHDGVLGKTLPELTGQNNGNESGNGNGIPKGRGKILLSFNGLAGDCTWAPFASYVYFFVTGPALARLTASRPVYEAARSSREIMRVSRKTFVSPATAAPGAFFAMDNREPLPPFMPLGGAEDTFYWEMKRKCFPDDYFAHVPWALLHQPPTVRQFRPPDMRRSREGFDFYSIVKAFLRSVETSRFSAATVAERIAYVAKQFNDFGTQAPSDFESNAKGMLKEEVGRSKSRLEQTLRENTDGCKSWRDDLERFIQNSWSSLEHPDISVPVDFLFLRGRAEAVSLAQTLIFQYGRLLEIWPRMMQRAAELRLQGIRVARTME